MLPLFSGNTERSRSTRKLLIYKGYTLCSYLIYIYIFIISMYMYIGQGAYIGHIGIGGVGVIGKGGKGGTVGALAKTGLS